MRTYLHYQSTLSQPRILFTQAIMLTDNKPVWSKTLKELLRNKIIEPSVSSSDNPIIPVQRIIRKLVVDYRQLNKKLKADKFSLPRIDDILDKLGKAKCFAIIGLFSGFHQIPLDVESTESTDSEALRFTSLPFGITLAPNGFSRMTSIAFAGVTPESSFLYMYRRFWSPRCFWKTI